MPGIGTSITLKPFVDIVEPKDIDPWGTVKTVTSCPALDQYFAQE